MEHKKYPARSADHRTSHHTPHHSGERTERKPHHHTGEKKAYVSKADETNLVVKSTSFVDAGAQYGHKVEFWSPTMKKYIYARRGAIHTLDVAKGALMLTEAYNKVKEIAAKGGKFLFVGTKANAKAIIQEEAIRSGSYYVVSRWLGGTMTNFKTLRKRVLKLRELEIARVTGKWSVLTKKENMSLEKERQNLHTYFIGLKEMQRLPAALFVCDINVEHNAIKEAKKLKIPVFAFADTNCDINKIDYPIPANDDGKNSIRLITGVIADAICSATGVGEIKYANKEVKFENPEDSAFQRKEVKRDPRAKNPNYKGKNPKFGLGAKRPMGGKFGSKGPRTFRPRPTTGTSTEAPKAVSEVQISIATDTNK